MVRPKHIPRKTQFNRWRVEMEFSQAAAARALGLSVGWIKDLDRGFQRQNGRPAKPDLRTRYAMAAVAGRLAPWPE